MSSAFELQRLAADGEEPHIYAELKVSPARINKARALINEIADGASILDIGCADGAMLEPFVGRLKVTGIDASEHLVKLAQQRGYIAKVADGEELPFENESFDAVFAGEVIEHTLSPDRFLNEVNRVLKPAGVLVLTAPNIRTPIGIAMLLYGIPPMYAARYRSAHLQDFTGRLLRQALDNNGFGVDYFGGSAFMIPKIGPRLAFLGDVFPDWSDHFIVRATKLSSKAYDENNEIQRHKC